MKLNRRLPLVLLAAMILVSCRITPSAPPAVALLEPANNTVVPDVVLVQARAAPLDGQLLVKLFVDRARVAEQTVLGESLVSLVWDASREKPWSRHSIYVTVTDEAERTARSDSVRVTVAATSGPTSHTGIISEDETWYAAGNPHVVRNIMDVEAVLTIQPGCVVEFEQDCGLDVGAGAIVARGGDTGITFTARNLTPGFWKAIDIGQSARPNQTILENCVIEYGGGPNRGAAVIARSPVTINNCRIRQSASSGIITLVDFLSFSGNTLTDNADFPVQIPALSVPTLGDGNRYSGNAPDAIVVVGDNYVNRDTRWGNPGVPYFIEGDLDVSSASALSVQFEIAPGTRLLFDDGGIEVDEGCTILADGTDGTISFAGGLTGISVLGLSDPASPSLIFKNCVIEEASSAAAIDLTDAAAEINGTRFSSPQGEAIAIFGGDPPDVTVVIRDCQIDDAEGDAAIYVEDANAEITNTSIDSVPYGAGVTVRSFQTTTSASALLTNCVIRNTRTAGVMAAIGRGGQTPSVFLTDCVVDKVTSGQGVYLSDAQAGLLRTRITNANDFGVVCDDESWFTEFRDDVISGCGMQAVSLDAEYARTIGTGNDLAGNGLYDERLDGVVLTGDNEVFTPGTWHNLGVPWLIPDNIYVDEAMEQFPTLTIEPGARLEFEDGAVLEFAGGLLADGTAGRITFTSGEPEASPGDWGGILFDDSEVSDRSILRNCLVEYGGGNDANIYCDGASPTIENCEISHSSGWGIELASSSLSPETLRLYNRFHDNVSGDIDSIGRGRLVRKPKKPATHRPLAPATTISRPQPGKWKRQRTPGDATRVKIKNPKSRIQNQLVPLPALSSERLRLLKPSRPRPTTQTTY